MYSKNDFTFIKKENYTIKNKKQLIYIHYMDGGELNKTCFSVMVIVQRE